MGIGECAGEVVSLVEFDLADAEREVFEAQLLLEAGDYQQAEARAYQAMLQAAKALVRTQFLDVGDDPDRIVEEFTQALRRRPNCSTRSSPAASSRSICCATTTSSAARHPPSRRTS